MKPDIGCSKVGKTCRTGKCCPRRERLGGRCEGSTPRLLPRRSAVWERVVSLVPEADRCSTHVVARFLALVALFVSLRFGIIRLLLLRAECLPSLAENLADLTCI